MSIDETDEVDFLWKDEERGRVMVTISDHRDWEDGGEHLLLLQEKLNTYFYFIGSGQLAERKPEYEGLPVVIH